MKEMLSVRGVVSGYGRVQVLREIDLDVSAGQIVAIVGANGAGKSTFLRAVSGLIPLWSGTIALDGQDVSGLPAHEMARRGLSHVPEGRKVFKPLSVLTNLELGSYSRRQRSRKDVEEDLNYVYSLFPILRERKAQAAGTLSGGEQQMLAVGRALMGRPRVLLLDEPSLGLAPKIFLQIFEVLGKIRDRGVAIVLVEQNVNLALQTAQYAYVLETGRVVVSGPSAEVLQSDLVRKVYLGEAWSEQA